ncbi:hypothetical protein EBZ80_23210, partial [bacterium]|nr:hypothetical protein [bacterium]
EKPPSVIEWAERNIQLDSRITARPGLYSTANSPYVRGVLEALADPGVHTVCLCWGSQTGKTLTLAVWLAYRIANDPAPSLLVMPNADLARSYSKTRLVPIFEKCKPVKALFPYDSDDFANLEMQFLNCTLTLTGSNSPANISSRPVCIAVLDELDKFAPPTDKETSAMSLCLERTKAFPEHRRYLDELSGRISGDLSRAMPGLQRSAGDGIRPGAMGRRSSGRKRKVGHEKGGRDGSVSLHKMRPSVDGKRTAQGNRSGEVGGQQSKRRAGPA